MRRVPMPLTTILLGLLLGACVEQEPADEMEAEEQPAAEEPAPTPAPSMSLADFEGSWNATTYLESGDTVEYTMTATADTSGWMIDLPDRDPMPMRILSTEGGSVVSEIGPYESILREGVMVTVRSTNRIENGRMVGTMEAHYAGVGADSIVRGRVEGTRGM